MKISDERMIAFATHIVNPLTRKVAGAAYSPFALLRHVGRRSGKTYETPIIVRRMADGFLITLTYGPEVDWYRNLVAAGGARLRWHGREYTLGKPEPLPPATALRQFPPPMRLILQARHTQHFVKSPVVRAIR